VLKIVKLFPENFMNNLLLPNYVHFKKLPYILLVQEPDPDPVLEKSDPAFNSSGSADLQLQYKIINKNCSVSVSVASPARFVFVIRCFSFRY